MGHRQLVELMNVTGCHSWDLSIVLDLRRAFSLQLLTHQVVALL